ncbi:hypothetical protein CEP52_001191 [Fusarium oligoseptatum]|uniref:Zn(2)-C6 fungal-type domain-containing protein n=1 Tax=Fusarium oligoseptatum TaxID=2604345 RepID=A0A428UK22_9HYPO|nr:hypothetical protein CEP52_001191 [Fusarium oligoseptatum]
MSEPSVGSPAAGASTALTKRKPMPRKGHTKSRAGCVCCKRRKVKCDEVAPQCGPCQRLGLPCEYLGKQNRSQSSSVARPLRTTPAMYDANDMNFFRHFLFEAYPPLPIDGFTVWQQASKLSHEFEFLLHAMLGLGASHLGLLTPNDYNKVALKHRVTAIRELNRHLSKPNITKAGGEAAFAAMLVLTFQSSYMVDGMVDFLTMVRGCWLVGYGSVGDLDETIFKTFARSSYYEKIKALAQQDDTVHYLDALIANQFCASVRRIAPFCKSVPELRYLAHMEKIASLAAVIVNCPSFYDVLGDLSSNDFAHFVDPQNHISQLVIMHTLVLDFVMSKKAVDEFGKTGIGRNGYDCRRAMSKVWIEQIQGRLPAEYQEYAEWPVKLVKSLNYSFDKDAEVWEPFLLSRGTATLSETDTLSLVEGHSDTDQASVESSSLLPF